MLRVQKSVQVFGRFLSATNGGILYSGIFRFRYFCWNGGMSEITVAAICILCIRFRHPGDNPFYSNIDSMPDIRPRRKSIPLVSELVSANNLTTIIYNLNSTFPRNHRPALVEEREMLTITF